MSSIVTKLPDSLKKTFISASSRQKTHDHWLSGIDDLDRFLNGGLPIGTLVEFGIPKEKPGRTVLLPYLARASKQTTILWVNSLEKYRIYPPAFFSRGILPSGMVFSEAVKPLETLKHVFLSPLFKIIVLDSSRVSLEECLFLKQQAFIHNQSIVLIRPYCLSNLKGNIWSKLRCNILKTTHGRYCLRLVKGQTSKNYYISEEELHHDIAEFRVH
ncbi:MAG: hypothetical protein HQM13_21430 [SAR324 cluster bacterium]|nr:hypothetical protein [SAR324 cluster bacterium]